MGVGCNPGHYPIRLLSPSTQMHVYHHFKDRQKAKELFRNLTDEKTYNDRLEEDSRSKGHLIVSSIEEWETAGFPGTWDDWWSQSWDRHVAEHKEWLVWLTPIANELLGMEELQKAAPVTETKSPK